MNVSLLGKITHFCASAIKAINSAEILETLFTPQILPFCNFDLFSPMTSI